MTQSAQPKNEGSNASFTSVQAYTLAAITLFIGIAVGYFARGSSPARIQSTQAAESAPPASGAAGSESLGPAQLPGIGSTQQQQGPSPETVAKAAEPLLAKLKANPADFDTLVKLGNLYYDSHAYQQAIPYYEKAIAQQPDNPDVRTDLGTMYWYTGDPDKAIASFEQALKIRPTHPGTLFNLGIVKWQGKKDPQGAVDAWQKLLATNPDYPQKDQVRMLIERAKMHGTGATKG